MGQAHAFLGNIPMELPTYMDSFDADLAADFAEHPKIGQKPRLQWVGDGLDLVDIDVSLHAQFCTPEVELAKLRNAIRAHEAMPLVFANGHIVGNFVLTRMHQRSRQTMRDGTVLVAEVRLSLKEYTEDGLGTEVAARGTPVAAMVVGAGGQERAPNGTQTVAPDARAAESSVVRGGAALNADTTPPSGLSYLWLPT